MSLIDLHPYISWTAVTIALYLIGAYAALDALFSSRSSQAAIAWGISLSMLPAIMLPIYIVFGRPRLVGYSKLSRKMSRYQKPRPTSLTDSSTDTLAPLGPYQSAARALERIARARFTSGNTSQIFSEGVTFFEALITEIQSAHHSVDLSFYLIRPDTIGQRLKSELAAATARGVTVRVLFDKLGSFSLSRRYTDELVKANILIASFNTGRTWYSFLHLNFRNHRKIAVIDNCVAYVGGFNVGDEYLGRSKEFGAWRDTQVRVTGPIVVEISSVFRSDWSWATQTSENAPPSQSKDAGALALTVATGPADEEDRATLFFLELITAAQHRFWITSPYFVPTEAIELALSLAVIRGVDVRIIIPDKGDNRIVHWATLHYARVAVRAGIQVYRYQDGFLHKKVAIIDDAFTVIGTVNLDSRSLRLNFEISLVFADKKTTADIGAMFKDDFANSLCMTSDGVQTPSWIQRCAGSFARLFSPVL